MNKAYSRINWVNDPDHTTPLNATNLNSMDSALDTIDDRVVALDSGKSTVTMTPALQSGTKVADYSIDGVEGSLYAPTGGGASALTDLTDTAISSPSNGQVLKYNTSTSKWENANESGGGGGSSSLSGLSDVALTTLSDGQFLAYDSATSKWKNVTGGGGAVDSVNGKTGDVVLTASDVGALADNTPIPSDLSDLSDVDTSGVTDGQILKYNGTSGKFEPSNESGGTSDYTQLTNKPQINGVALSGNKTSADLGISGGGSNENLIPNGWFSINTKNTATFNALFDGTSKVDGWLTNVNSGGQAWTWTSDTNTIFLNCTLGTGFGQILHEFDKNPLISGKEFTLSVLYADGTIKTKTATYQNSSSAEWVTDTYSGSFAGVYSVPSSNNYLSAYFRCNEGYSALIKAIKLEIGGSSTLIVDTFPNPNTEKVRCNGVMRSNRNLLDNPWFTVNQKGFTSGSIATIGESVPFIDRWKGYWQTGNTSTVSLSNNQLTFTIPSGVGCGIQQGSEILTAYTSGTATVSIMFADGTILSQTIALTTGCLNYQIGTYNDLLLEYRHYTSFNTFEFVFSNSTDSQKAVTIKAVKFELGTESTLALDTAPDYASELLKCQRYYYPLSGKSYNSMVPAMQQTRQFMTITLPTEMRAVPTFNGSLTTEGISGSTRVDDTVTSSNITVTNKQGIEFNFTTSNNFNLCSSARVSFTSGSYLSAEL